VHKGWMLFLSPSHQCKSTEEKSESWYTFNNSLDIRAALISRLC